MSSSSVIATFDDRAVHGGRSIVRQVIWVIVGSVILAISARVQAPTWPVPVTLQDLAVLLIAATFGSRLATISVLIYLAEGVIGLPVYARPPFAGPHYLLGPTGGYLFGFLAAAWIVGLLADRGWMKHVYRSIMALSAGQFVILLMGWSWLAIAVGPWTAFQTGVQPFLAGSLFKVLFAGMFVPRIVSRRAA